MSSFPTTLSDLTFQSSFDPASNTNIYKVLSTLRKSTLSIPNRLLSIVQDATFVESLYFELNVFASSHTLVQHASPFTQTDSESIINAINNDTHTWPLVPNERSGSWPLVPHLKLHSQQAYLQSLTNQSNSSPVSAYFKSTDGHVNQWSFSTRRLNLPVLDLLGFAGGAVLIDTTRRGKAYPDALRRTVPMFTTVWNRLLFPDLIGAGVCNFQSFGLEKGEISQIESRLPNFVRELKALGLDLDGIKKRLGRPVRCIWISQPFRIDKWQPTFDGLVDQIRVERSKWEKIGGVSILVCCSASRQVVGAEMSDEGYIQGAGDDSEGWSQGLTSRVFWDHYDELMDMVKNGGDVEDLVKSLVQHEKLSRGLSDAVLIKPTPNIYLTAGSEDIGIYDLIVDCNGAFTESATNRLDLGCKEAKLGSKMLREQLPRMRETVAKTLSRHQDAKILVRCSTGKDLSVGVILTILCIFYDDNGSVKLDQNRYIDKQFIKQRLAWITTSKPDANPSRATLQAVNSFLMQRPD